MQRTITTTDEQERAMAILGFDFEESLQRLLESFVHRAKRRVIKEKTLSELEA